MKLQHRTTPPFTCRECGIAVQTLEEATPGRQLCKRCGRFYQNKRNALVKHGIESGEYEAMLLSSGGKCPICKTSFEERRFAIDHEHKTGRVRGLICVNCNVGIGHFKDDVGLLEATIQYLKNKGVIGTNWGKGEKERTVDGILKHLKD